MVFFLMFEYGKRVVQIEKSTGYRYNKGWQIYFDILLFMTFGIDGPE
jgi:hypothetical protein